MLRKSRYAFALPLLILLAACQTLNLNAPKSFNEKSQDGYAAVTAIANTAATLYAAGTITDKDAQNVVSTATSVKDGLDIARQVHSTNPTAGDDKLAAAIQALTALQNYLVSRSKK